MNKYIKCKDCKEQYDCERTYLGGCTDGKAWEKKLTDEEILKAVECCVEEVAKCTDCPYAEKNRKCIKLSNDVKLLVYRLQDENATLSKVINSSKRKTKILELQREIERLRRGGGKVKAVLISIQPKWVEKIASGKKTIEVRKSRPKLETPVKCYIYCTTPNPKTDWEWQYKPNLYIQDGKAKWIDGAFERTAFSHYAHKKVIGEFVCDRIDEYRAEFTDLKYHDAQNKNVCQNTIKRVEYDEEECEVFYRYETSNEEDNPDNCKFLKESCLTFNEVRKYIGETFFDKPFYGWHISDLKIYDKPKELSEFRKPCPYTDDTYCLECKCEYYDDYSGKCCCKVERPPQSWCYTEE